MLAKRRKRILYLLDKVSIRDPKTYGTGHAKLFLAISKGSNMSVVNVKVSASVVVSLRLGDETAPLYFPICFVLKQNLETWVKLYSLIDCERVWELIWDRHCPKLASTCVQSNENGTLLFEDTICADKVRTYSNLWG